MRRRAAVPVLFTLALVACGGGGASGPTDPPTAPASETPTDGQPSPSDAPSASDTPTDGLSFTDDFSDPASGWQADPDGSSTATYADGGLQLDQSEGDEIARALLTAVESPPDVRVEFDVRFGDRALLNAGFECRRTDAGSYTMGVTTAGFANILRREADGITPLTSMRFEPAADGVIHVMAACEGNVISLGVPGQDPLEIVDQTHTTGDIGLEASGEGVATFDDFALEASTPRRGGAPVPEPAPLGTVVLADDFTTDKGWAPTTSNGSALVLSAEPGGVTHVVSSAITLDGGTLSDLSDVSIEADVTVDQPRSMVGLSCRHDGTAHYFGSLAMDTGFATLWRHGEEREVLVFRLLEDAVGTVDVPHHLRLDCVGDVLTFSVDGEVAVSYVDPVLSDGAVGFALESGPEAESMATATFDNALVGEPG